MNNFKINNSLLNEIKAFAKLNKIDDVDNFIHEIIRNGFMSEKYKDHLPIKNKETKETNTSQLINSKKDLYDE